MKNINWKTFLTGMLTVGTLAFIGGVFDFQNIKAEVRSGKQKIEELKKVDVQILKTLKTMGILMCNYAIREELKDANVVCKGVL